MSPDITVVVPYRNEKETIQYTLQQLAGQSFSAKVVILVNSSSTDDTFEIVHNWIELNQHRYPTIFKNIFENTNNPGSSKNVGIRHSDTEWIAFMDCGQRFGLDWLERQYRFAEKTGAEVVGGTVYLVGENWIDRCAVAQVYGYKRSVSFCVPTTLVRKRVFERTGLFLVGRRAGYDVAWLKELQRLGISREINEEVQIRYVGFNYSSSIRNLFNKAVLYAKPCVGIQGYFSPYVYIFFPATVLFAFAVSSLAGGISLITYFVARQFVLPIYKSGNIRIFTDHPFESLVGLFFVGLVLDMGKMFGTIMGIWQYWLRGLLQFKDKTPVSGS